MAVADLTLAQVLWGWATLVRPGLGKCSVGACSWNQHPVAIGVQPPGVAWCNGPNSRLTVIFGGYGRYGLIVLNACCNQINSFNNKIYTTYIPEDQGFLLFLGMTGEGIPMEWPGSKTEFVQCVLTRFWQRTTRLPSEFT